MCIQQAQPTLGMSLTFSLIPAEQKGQQIFSLNFLSHQFCANIISSAPAYPPFARVDGEDNHTCGLAGRAPPLGLFLLKSQITEHADPYRRANALQALPESDFWSVQSVRGAGEWRLKTAEIRGG